MSNYHASPPSISKIATVLSETFKSSPLWGHTRSTPPKVLERYMEPCKEQKGKHLINSKQSEDGKCFSILLEVNMRSASIYREIHNNSGQIIAYKGFIDDTQRDQ